MFYRNARPDGLANIGPVSCRLYSCCDPSRCLVVCHLPERHGLIWGQCFHASDEVTPRGFCPFHIIALLGFPRRGFSTPSPDILQWPGKPLPLLVSQRRTPCLDSCAILIKLDGDTAQ